MLDKQNGLQALKNKKKPKRRVAISINIDIHMQRILIYFYSAINGRGFSALVLEILTVGSNLFSIIATRELNQISTTGLTPRH